MSDEKNLKVHLPSATLGEIKTYLYKEYENGCMCPACNQFVKLYKRKFASTMAYCLILFVIEARQNNNAPTKFTKFLDQKGVGVSNRADWQKLVYFKMIIPDPTMNGFYTVSQLGIDFVEGRKTAPEHVKVYNGKTYGFSIEQLTIKQALKNKFNIDDLLN